MAEVPEYIRFQLADGSHIDVIAFVAMTASDVVRAAVLHDSKLPDVTTADYFEFPLVDWPADVARIVIFTMVEPVKIKPTFDFWIDMIALAMYLAINKIRELCAVEIFGDVDLPKLIAAAIQYRCGDVLVQLGKWAKINDSQLTAALAPVATADIVWMISAGHWPKVIAAHGIVSRSATADTQEILRHMPLALAADQCKFILDNCEILDPTSRHLLEYIVDVVSQIRSFLPKVENLISEYR